MTTKAQEILERVFGYTEFRHAQSDIINAVVAGQNTLAIMPTGGGKSLCYQVPALMFEGLTLVISPLISLMQDQVRQLNAASVAAGMLNSSLSPESYNATKQQVESGELRLLFLAPETALQPSLAAWLQTCSVACIAIDEAHCISEWGHDFRPEYRQLDTLISSFPAAVVVALTATATPRVRADIRRQLAIDETNEFVASFDRDNLFIEIIPKASAYQQTLDYIQKHKGQAGIIYVQSRAGVDELCQRLQADGIQAVPYHAGLSAHQRTTSQELFIRDDVSIVVATVAFGMGINKPDVRFVLHYDLPKNIESYYQQIGRAGRDGLPADCLLLFSYGDTGKIRYFIDGMTNEQEQRLATLHLNQLLALVETEDCRRIPLLQYFGETFQAEDCVNCDNCTGEKKEKSDLTIVAQKFLSCVYRTGQRFGASHIADVLRGSNAEKILQNRHNLVSTYGIGTELSKKQWLALSRQLIQRKLLRQDEQFGGLSLTPSAGDVLKGAVPFLASIQQVEAGATKRKKSAVLMDADQVLLDTLKTERKRLADSENLPPYAIFADRTLQEIAHYFPQSESSLLKIHGVGQGKLVKYGEVFLRLVVSYCAENDIAEVANQNTPGTAKLTSVNKPGKRQKEAVEALESGETFAQIAERFGVQEATVQNHVYQYVQHQAPLKNTDCIQKRIELDEQQLSRANELLAEHGHQRLKPIFEGLEQQVSYEQLHLVRILYLNQKAKES